MSNCFIVKNGTIITAPKNTALLGGITRELVLKLAKENGLPTQERDIHKDELFAADEVWMTSSNKEIRPVVTIDGHAIADANAGPLWHEIQRYYQHFKASY